MLNRSSHYHLLFLLLIDFCFPNMEVIESLLFVHSDKVVTYLLVRFLRETAFLLSNY